MIIQENSDDTYPTIHYNSTNTIVGISILNRFFQEFDYSQYLNITAANVEFKNWGYKFKFLDVDRCSNVYKNRTLEFLPNTMCMKNPDFNITGYVDQLESSQMGFNISICSNETQKVIKCKSPEEIKQQIFGSYVIIYFYENLLNPNNYSHPFTLTKGAVWDFLDYDLAKAKEINFKKLTLKTDDGLIFQNKYEENKVVVESFSANQRVRSKEETELAIIRIYASRKTNYVVRNYIRIQNVFANIGGIIDSLRIIGAIVVAFISKKQLELDLINNYFDFGNYELKKENINRSPQQKKFINVTLANNISEIKKSQISPSVLDDNKLINEINLSPDMSGSDHHTNIKNSNFTDRSHISSNKMISIPSPTISNGKPAVDNDLQLKLKNYINNRNNPDFMPLTLNYTIWQILKSNLCPVNVLNKDLQHKEFLTNLAFKKVKIELDAVGLMNISKEINFLKKCIFNEKQVGFLSFLEKRKFFEDVVMNYYEKDTSFAVDFTEKPKRQEFEFNIKLQQLLELSQYFSEKKTTDSFSKYDDLIFSRIDSELKKILEL